MAQRSRDFDEFIRRSLYAAAESVLVGDDGLDKIRIQIAQARSSAAAHDRQFAVRGTRSARADHLSAGRGRGEGLDAEIPIRARARSQGRQLDQAPWGATGRRHRGQGPIPKPCA